MNPYPQKPVDPEKPLWVKFRIKSGEVFDAKITAAQAGKGWLEWVSEVVVKATKKYGEVKR